MAYLAPYLTLVLPNLLILAPLFFALGALTRKMRAVYVSAVVLLVGYLLAGDAVEQAREQDLGGTAGPVRLVRLRAADRILDGRPRRTAGSCP